MIGKNYRKERGKDSFLIAIEGIDGVGKTSAIKPLKAHMESLGYHVIVTAEPYLERTIEIIHGEEGSQYDQDELYCLFLRDRECHYKDFISPALKNDKTIVITDRYLYSSVAYNSGVDIEPWRVIADHHASGIPEADILILLDMDVEKAKERIRQTRGGKTDSLEQSVSGRTQRIFRTLLDAHDFGAYVDASQDITKVGEDTCWKTEALISLLKWKLGEDNGSEYRTAELSELFELDGMPCRNTGLTTRVCESLKTIKGNAMPWYGIEACSRSSLVKTTDTLMLVKDLTFYEKVFVMSPTDKKTAGAFLSAAFQLNVRFDVVTLF